MCYDTIKMSNEKIKQIKDLNDLNIFIDAYILFKMDKLNEATICPSVCASFCGYKFNKNNINYGDSARILQTITNKVNNDEEYTFIPSEVCKDKNKITFNKPVVLSCTYEDPEDQYTQLSVREFISLIDISKHNNLPVHKLFNIYIIIKSHIYYDSQRIMYTYLRDQSIIDKLGCDYRTFVKYETILIQSKMIYKYDVKKYQYVDNNKNVINSVYALNEYNIDELNTIIMQNLQKIA